MEKSETANKMPRTKAEVRDRISDLPDSLLLHILSFLPAKEVIATSLLSKRWRPLCFSLPTLEFRRKDFQTFTFFHKFVDKMLELVDLEAVKKFVFECEYYYKSREYFRPRRMSDWINAVIINKVEHLVLHLYIMDDDYELPSNIFTAKNIKVLRLTGGVLMGSTLSHVNLSLLQVLHLDCVRFPDSRSLGILLSGSVLLRDLVIKYLHVDPPPLDIGGLNHLVTAEVPQTLIPLRVLSNVTFLRLVTCSYILGPDIPMFYNLTYLEFAYYPIDWKTTLRLLQSCPKLEILVIQRLWGEKLKPTVTATATADVPQCVSSNLKEFHLGNCRGRIEELNLARYIMKNAMVLRIISISKNFTSRVTWKNRILKKNTFVSHKLNELQAFVEVNG